MTNGLVTELNELIALRRYAKKQPAKLKGRAARGGTYLSPWRGRGMDFAEVRNYQSGDEMRHMDWRVTARTGKAHIKLYQEERERPIIILTDFNASMYFGTRIAFKSVIAARLAALLAWVGIKQGDRVGGLLYSAQEQSEFMPKSREGAILPFLAALSRYTQLRCAEEEVARPMSAALHRLQRVISPGSLLIIISDFYALDQESETHLNRLRIHHDLLAYHICDPLELAPPQPQYYGISNGKDEELLDTSNQVLHTAYQAYCQQRITHLQEQLQRAQIPYIQVTAEANMPKIVQQTFSRRLSGG